MTEPDTSRRRPAGVQVLKVGAVVAAIALVVWWLPLGSDTPPASTAGAPPESTTSRPPPDSRPRPPQVEDSLPLPDGAYAYAAAWDGSHLWVLAADEPHGDGDPFPDEATVLAFDPATGEVALEVPVSGGPSHLAVDADGVWVVLREAGWVTQLDPVNGDSIVTADLSDDAAPVEWLVVALGAALVGTEDGQVQRIGAYTGEVTPVVELTPEQSGEVIVDQGEVWVLSRAGDPSATLIDPLEATSQVVPFDAVDHDVTHGGFAFAEMALGSSADQGSVVTIVDRSSLQPVETVEGPGTVVHIGWVAGSFGTLDEDGVFQRLRPTDLGTGRFQTSWDGQSPLFPLDEELWTLSDTGTSLDRVVLTGNAD